MDNDSGDNSNGDGVDDSGGFNTNEVEDINWSDGESMVMAKIVVVAIAVVMVLMVQIMGMIKFWGWQAQSWFHWWYC